LVEEKEVEEEDDVFGGREQWWCSFPNAKTE
jgi:hypothetical protein